MFASKVAVIERLSADFLERRECSLHGRCAHCRSARSGRGCHRLCGFDRRFDGPLAGGSARDLQKARRAAEVDTQAASFELAASELATTLDVPVERLMWVEVPITAKVAASNGDSASVDVWTVSVLGAPSTGSPQQVWRTVHIDLELSSGRWLVTAANADQGPTPAANELALQSGWKDFQVVASWPAVVKGVGL